MKKFILFSICVALVSLGCRKSTSVEDSGSGSGSGSTYYIRASVNDTAKTFNVNAMAMQTTFAGFTSLSIFGNVTSASNLEAINITINNSPSGKPIIAGTYTEDGPDFAVAGVYNPGSSTIVYGAGVYPSPVNPLNVIITAIDDKTVKGTFSGDFFYTNASTGTVGLPKKVFTNGEFFVKF